MIFIHHPPNYLKTLVGKRVTYQKAILMYRIMNNICPDYLKKLSCRLLTYHEEEEEEEEEVY